VVHVHDGFDFLKYRQRLDWFTGEVRRRPAAKSYWRYAQRVAKKVLEAPPADMLKEVVRYRRKWVKAFPRWRLNWFSRLYLWLATRAAIQEGMRRVAQNHDIGQPST
jgi:hypothetical protein